jgi:hypothetical protein
MRALVDDYMKEYKCSKGTAITACAKKYPNAVNDFLAPGKK